jgi:hypothetical protein
MDKIEEQLNNTFVVDVPKGMHQLIMRRVNYKKIQPFLFITFSLLLINFIVIGWHINAKLVDAEFMDMMRDFFEVFSFNFSFINIFIKSFFDIVSPMLAISAVLSLGGAIYTAIYTNRQIKNSSVSWSF